MSADNLKPCPTCGKRMVREPDGLVVCPKPTAFCPKRGGYGK